VVAGSYLALTVVLVGAGLLITHLLAHSVGRWDDHTNAWFAHHRTSTGNRVTGDFTLLANTFSVVGVAAVVAVIALVRRRAHLAVLLGIGLVVELAVFLTTTYAVARPRPSVPHLGSTPSTFSWPSGHVAATFVLYGGIAVIVTLVTRRLLPRILTWTLAGLLTACVGLSRIYRGDHHPSDAIAGLVLGAGALCAAVMAVRTWADKRAASEPRADEGGT
jgi:membrane-associated phospholipid phosphatase